MAGKANTSKVDAPALRDNVRLSDFEVLANRCIQADVEKPGSSAKLNVYS